MADELGRYLQDRPIAARPVGRLTKVARWCRRQPVRAGLIAALLLAILLGAFGVLWQWQRTDRQRRRAEAGELHARQVAYVSDMNLAFQAVEAEKRGRALELLRRYSVPQTHATAANELRHWEWRHLWKRCQSDAILTLTNYTYAVAALAVSGNGRWLAVSTASNVVIWDLVTRQPRDLLPITAVPAVVDLSADGGLVACAQADMTGLARDFNAVVFDTTTRAIVARFPHAGAWWLARVALSPDHRVLATLDWEKDDGFLRVWHLETKQCLRSIQAPPGSTMLIGELRFSPDSQLLAIGQSDGHVRLIDWATGDVREDIPAPTVTRGVTALAFSPDGKLLLAGYGWDDPHIYLWNAQTGERAGELAGHRGWISSLCLPPDGRTLASASADQTIRLWDLAARKEIRRFYGHADEVWSLVVLPDGNGLVSGGRDGSLCLWNTTYQTKDSSVASLPVDTRDFAFTPDSQQVVTVNGDGRIEFWDAGTLKLVASLARLGTNNLCLSLASRSGRRLLAAGQGDGWVNVWDVTSRAEPWLLTSFKAHNAGVAVLKFDRRAQVLMSSVFPPGHWADADVGNLKAWDTSSWRERPEFAVGSHLAAYLPESNLMVLRRGPVGLDFAVRDLRTGRERMIATGHKEYLNALVFSPDGQWLASANNDGTVRLWDVRSWRCRATLTGMGSVRDVAFSPDGRRLVTGSSPVKLWDLATCQELASFSLNGLAVGFSPDGSTLAVRDSSATNQYRLSNVTGVGQTHFWRAPSLEEIGRAERSLRNAGDSSEVRR